MTATAEMNRIRCFPTVPQWRMLQIVAATGLHCQVENGHVVLTDGEAGIFEAGESRPYLKSQRFLPPEPPEAA